MEIIYMIVKDDKYELPIVVANRIGEIANLLGTSKSDIYKCIKKHTKKKYKKLWVKIIKVVIEDER